MTTEATEKATDYSDIRRVIWLYIARQEGRVTADDIGKALSLRPSEVLNSMVQRRQLSRIPAGRLWAYAVTTNCRIPRGLSLDEVMAAVGMTAQIKPGDGHQEAILAARDYAPVPGSLPWRLCRHFQKNPEALLNRREIIALFSLSESHGLDGNIQQALVNGAIREVREPGKEMRWGKGPSDRVVLRDLTAPAEKPRDERAKANDPFRMGMA